jgi:hypothetical protein
MGEQEFVALCKKEVVAYVNRNYADIKITEKDVYVVWLCKTLQNSKALLSTNIEDGMYYELTYNGDKGELYVDAYEKVDNTVVIV